MVAVLTCLAAWRVGWPEPLEAMDQRQGRLDEAAPLPKPGLALEQSFVAQHDGLTAIELLLVVWPPEEDQESEPAILTLRILDDGGQQLYAASWDASKLNHNDPLRFTFSPIRESAGKRYRLRIEGTAANRATVWAYSLDGYPRGELSAGDNLGIGDLRFQTVYRYQLPVAMRDLASTLVENLGLILVLAILLVLPGAALIPRFIAPDGDLATFLGLAVAGSLALLPLGWLWLGLLGGRIGAPLLCIALGAAALIALFRYRQSRRFPRINRETMILAGIVLLALAVRLLAIRDLVLPNWVDSPQHWLISRIMADSGRVPKDYRPWMPVDVYWYHFGFHALAALIGQLVDTSLAKILLVGGQVLNALAPLSVYSGVVLLTGRRRTGLAAAFFVGLLSLFPAYFVTWGRYTQLTGMLILPLIIAVAYRLFHMRSWKRTIGIGLWLGMALGGLFLVHARVWVYAIVWLPVAVLATTPSTNRMRSAGVLLIVVCLAVALSMPWWVQVGRHLLLPMMSVIDVRGDPGDYNAIPWDYVTFGWERVWLVMAGMGLAWALLQLVSRRAGQGRTTFCNSQHIITNAEGAIPVALLGGWVIFLFLLINANRIGAPTFGLVNNNTLFISLYLPVGILLGWLVDGWYQLAVGRAATRIAAQAVLAAAAVWCGLYGVRQQVGVVNPETVLVRPDDIEVLEWAAHHLPADSLVAVNAWLWLEPENWAGSDAGYWFLPLAGRQSTMPPIGYSLDVDYRNRVNGFNQQLTKIESWDDSGTLALLQERGVTHLFIGERGGEMRPEELITSPFLELLHSNGAAWVFKVR